MSDDGHAGGRPAGSDGRETALDAGTAQENMADHGFHAWLDLSVAEVGYGRAVLELPYEGKLTNPITETVHGGITASVIDSASGVALRTTFEDPERAMLATVDMNVAYVRPARSDLRIEAEVVRAGDSVGVTSVDVTGVSPGGERKTVATGSTTYRLFRGGSA